MERRSGTVEDLPPLELRELRSLDLEAPPGPGASPHVSAASGVVRRGEHVYVIGDDQLFVARFRLTSTAPGTAARVLSGTLPEDEGERTEVKPDLEVLSVLPPFSGHPFGALLGLGSGSARGRDRGFVWGLASDGSLAGEPREIDLSPLYDLLRREIPELNVEGASVMGDRLWVLHRGNHEGSPNAVAELSLADVIDSVHGDLTIDPSELDAVRAYDLGELDGVRLAFSDATPLGGRLMVFTASAEAPGADGPDGAIHGSVVGTIDLDGDVQRLRTIDRRYKVEGVHASTDAGVIDFLFVCDQDDPDAPSPLLSATMPVDGRLEHGS
jgi:hypothetical protein